MHTLDRVQEVKDLFQAALEHPPNERTTFLREACHSHPSLQHEVESLLTAYLEDEDFLESPAIGLSATDAIARVMREEEELASATGTRIGNYRLVREIGRGGMGVIYLAQRDDDEYAQQVAIKLIKRGMDTEAVLRRFRKERQILADLNHPNIAKLLDGGQTADGLPFIVMEYIEGLPIHEYCRIHHLSTDERLKLFLSVCDTVHYVHHHQLIHRDLKPSNLLVTADGTLKLLDFGITKLLNAEAAVDSDGDATVTALRVMTPEYASPEQLRGLTMTPLSDLYSLGVLLFELLTGERPHSFPSRVPHEILQTLEQIELVKPSLIVAQRKSHLSSDYKDIESSKRGDAQAAEMLVGEPLSRRLRGDLDNIVLMALSVEPQRRYASVEQFAEDIRHHLAGLPVTARKDTLAYRCTKFLKRHKTSVIAAAVALLCLIVGLSFSRLMGPPNSRESVAVMPFITTNQDPNTQYIPDAISETLMDYVSRIPNLSVPARGAVLRYKGTEDPQLIGQALGVEVLVTGSVTVEGETVSVKIELLDTKVNQVISSKRLFGKTSEILMLQQELAKEFSQKMALQIDPPAHAAALKQQTKNEEAYRLYLRGNYFWNQRSPLGLRQGIESFQAAIDKDPNYALAYVGIANSYTLLAAYSMMPPKEAFAAGKSAIQKAFDIDQNLAEGHNALAMIKWLFDWDWAAADNEFKRAIELNPSYARAHHWYGLYLAEMGRFEEGILQEKLALEIDPNSVYIRADLGRVYFYARQYPEALKHYRKAAELAPTHEAFFAECMPLYEQLNMYDEWFALTKLMGWLAEGDKKLFTEPGVSNLRRRWIRILRSRKVLGYEYTLAEYYTQEMEKDHALEMLDRAYEIRDHKMAQLKVNPRFDNLRSDPRFKNLLRRMNLAP